MIRLATRADEDQIRQIWKQCFDDTDQFITEFLTYILTHGKIYVLEFDGIIVSMSSMIYGELSGNPMHTIVYLYGVATKKEFQKKGYAKNLIDSIVREQESQNIGVVLVLGHRGLVPFYEQLGFTRFSELREFFVFEKEEEISVIEREKAKKEITQIDILEYTAMRSRFSAEYPYSVCWGTSFMNLCFEDHLSEGGYVVSIAMENEKVGAWFKIEEDELKIIEITAHGQKRHEAAVKLCKANGLVGSYYIGNYDDSNQRNVISSMCSSLVKNWIGDQVGYINLVLN